MPLTPGSSFGPYRITEPLGRGGMASVHKAYEAGLDRYVALKVLPTEFLHDTTFAERFQREAKVVARLEHPNIIPIYAYGIDEGTPWMAMRLVTGGALSGLLKQGPLDARRGVAILGGVAAALDHAHGQGVFHRDVKPQNILLDAAHHVYLADFGIARMVEGSTVLTRTGLITGTPQYMAPEQAQGAKTLDHRCDIYALGVVAYEMLTGRVPFTADTPVAVLMKHILEAIPLPPPSEVPEPVMRPLLKCLAKGPDDRWPAASAFVRALEQGLGETSGAAPTAEVDAQSREPRTGTVAVPMPPAGAAAGDPVAPGAHGARPTAPTAPSPATEAPRPVRPREPQRQQPPPPRPVPPGARPSGRSRPLLLGVVLGGLAAVVAALVVILILRREPAPAASPAATAVPPTSAVEQPSAKPPAPTPSAPPAPAANEAVVQVRTNVTGATLRIDGRDSGAVPAEVKLAPGRHLVEIHRSGCNPGREWIEVAAGEMRRVSVDVQCPAPPPERQAAAAATLAPTPPPTPAATQAPAPQPTPPGPRAGEVRRNAKDGLEYVWIAPGTFQMGCVPGDFRCSDDEKPRHTVTISRGFWMSRTEVTVAAYRAYASPTGSQGGEDHPVVYVSWDKAVSFCRWSGGRLPTEAEWEYAARGGREGSQYPWGDAIGHDNANSQGTGGRDQWDRTAPVGSFEPNGFGLYDMAGNAWEWVADWHDWSYYGGSPSTDPGGPSSGQDRALRGGSWYFPGDLRVSNRDWFDPGYGNDHSGLRCVRDAIP